MTEKRTVVPESGQKRRLEQPNIWSQDKGDGGKRIGPVEASTAIHIQKGCSPPHNSYPSPLCAPSAAALFTFQPP
jgi:hypothetical protein